MQDKAEIGRLTRNPNVRVPSELYGEIGATGTKIFSGYISDDYNPDLQALKAVPTYDRMRRSDGQTQAILMACELPIRSARWYFEPASDDPKHVALADFTYDSLFNFGHQSFDDYLRFALGMHWAGFSYAEKIFGVNKQGYLMWEEFADRLQNTVLRWEQEGPLLDKLRGITQQPPPTYRIVFIPRAKVMLHTYRQEGSNWAGMSLLRGAYKHWFIADYLMKVANIGFERMAGGLPVIELPPDPETAEVNLAKEIVQSLRMGDEQAGVVKPHGMGLELLETGGKFMDHLTNYIDKQHLLMARAALASFLNMAGENVGSFALSQDQSQLFLNSLDADADYLAQKFNHDAIPQLLHMNFAGLELEDMPKLMHSSVGQRDPRFIGRTLQALATSGLLTPDMDLEEHLREMLDLPDIPEWQRQMPMLNSGNVDQSLLGVKGDETIPPDPTGSQGPRVKGDKTPGATVKAPVNGGLPIAAPSAKAAADPRRPSNVAMRKAAEKAYVVGGGYWTAAGWRTRGPRTAAEGDVPTDAELNAAAEKRVDAIHDRITQATAYARTRARRVVRQQQP